MFKELFKNDSLNERQTTTDYSNKYLDKQNTNCAEKAEYENDQDSTLIPSLLEQHGVNYEDEAFAQRMEAEEKKRRRMKFRGF